MPNTYEQPDEVRVWFHPDYSSWGGRWHASVIPGDDSQRPDVPPPVPSVARISTQLRDGSEHDGLPDGCQAAEAPIEAALALLARSYRPTHPDALDVTAGWADESDRLAFLDRVAAIDDALRRALGASWQVSVSREPGVTEVRLEGEYGCEWPLWVHYGLSDDDDWPMLSDGVRQRLRAWAREAEPDRMGDPDPEATERLLRDLRAELGDRFVVDVRI